MELTRKLLSELQKRLKIGNRRGVHLNAIPANSRYKFDLNRLSNIQKDLPTNFIKALLTEQPLKFRISWKENVPDLNSLFEEEQTQLVKITKSFENLINQTEAIEAEKGINTFGFGYPVLIRRDKADNKLTVAPVLIWSLRIKRTREFNTWEINRNEEDPVYLNEVLVNHLESDAATQIDKIPEEMLDDGLISKNELLDICVNLLQSINTTIPSDLKEVFERKIGTVVPIGDKKNYEKLSLPSANAFIDFGGLFSIFEVQKQNIINDYKGLMDLEGLTIQTGDLEGNQFQSISSIETDPSQQGILHSLETTRNVLIQGPPGTGKSQTLTAVLLNALENRKKVLVVCEKQTALDVLHKALKGNGLDYHCTLIKDIAKDRKNVVESVRSRVDNVAYRRYSYSYSKEALDHQIKKAKHLITSINTKHRKLGEKLLGEKSWTQVVGNLLAELKGTDNDYKLNADKTQFVYTVEEFNMLLDNVHRGEGLFADFMPIVGKSFINAEKFNSSNPYALEQAIHDDFDFYTSEVAAIKSLIEKNKTEYTEFRQSELRNQIALINTCVNNIFQHEERLNDVVNYNFKTYEGYRQEELRRQSKLLFQCIADIDAIFERNKKNTDLTDEVKLNSFGYKVLALFSKQKKQTKVDFLKLKERFTSLEEDVRSTKDFNFQQFTGDLNAKKTALAIFKEKAKQLESGFDETVIREYATFQFPTLLSTQNPENHLKAIQQRIGEEVHSEEFAKMITTVLHKFQSYLDEMAASLSTCQQSLIGCKDIRDNFGLSLNGSYFGFSNNSSYSEKKQMLLQGMRKLENGQLGFDEKILSEFDGINLHLANPRQMPLESLPILQGRIDQLIKKFNADDWTGEKLVHQQLPTLITDLESIIQKKNTYFNHPQDLFLQEYKWRYYYNSQPESVQKLLQELKHKKNWRKLFLIHYLNSLLVSNACVELPTNDIEHHELNGILSGLEKEQLKYVREFWFSKQIDATREFEQKRGTLTVENLYNKRSSNKYARLSLRQIVQYDADLFTTFFPIVLTSPDVCSNLFKGMNSYFDIVMFDEASQLRLEDNLPALLKGKQIIIAGDEHQMPPSNYFSKVFDGSIEDEDEIEDEEDIVIDKDNLLLSCESLLDFGTELNFEKRYLDFHYRSRHPYLIDFSNHAFYNQRLRPLPNNFDYTPIKFVAVNGTFSDHTNEAEAEMVLSIIENNINRLPNGEYPTVGVATFNIAQRNLIKGKILERQKFSKYAAFNDKIRQLEENGMFVKNLENIQGDERDVIILSTTYGVGKDGKFAQRFGPINHSKGYKLLNVIITRAKFKVYVCSSIPEEVILNYKDYLVTEGGNNKRAVFYAYLAYSKAVSENNNDLRIAVLTDLSENTSNSASFNAGIGELESPFEEEVYQVLVDEFGEQKLIPQMQFAGFRIDIVFDHKKQDLPKIAIECDGAKFHTSREAYLHDRYRQKILEGHGFVFHRIWSTNWWRNPKREADRLFEFIKNTAINSNFHPEDHSSTAAAFTHEIDVVENYVAKSFVFDEGKEGEAIKLFKETEAIQPKLFEEAIRLNSKVKVKYVNNGKDINVCIVDTEGKNEVKNGVQKIYVKSALATSIIGRTVGDIVKVGNLDNYVEILEVTN
ncbi:MAG: AAA domain-containing protein [Flavisolibacter sp.]